MLLVSKPKLPEWNDTRRSLLISYRQLLAKHCPSVMTIGTSSNDGCATMGIERQAIIDHLRNHGIQTTIPYPPVQLTFTTTLPCLEPKNSAARSRCPFIRE